MATQRLLHELQVGDVPKVDTGGFIWQPVDNVNQRRARAVPAARAPGADPPALARAGVDDQRPLIIQGPGDMARHVLDHPDIQVEKVKPLTEKDFPLNLLEDKIFAGTGYNVIWRPRSEVKGSGDLEDRAKGDFSDVLELNLTAETMAFSKSLGNVPNRGSGKQADIMLKGISYVQRVGAFENEGTGKNDDPTPAGIHFEPGVFMLVPGCDMKPKAHPAVINRMGSVPHGTTINAQGPVPKPADEAKGSPKDLKPTDKNAIPVADIKPFQVAPPNKDFIGPFQKMLNFDGKPGKDFEDRLPNNFEEFRKNKSITKEILADPNQILRNALPDKNDDQEIESFITFKVATPNSTPFTPNPATLSATPVERRDPTAHIDGTATNIIGGGTSNIGFLQGTNNPGEDKQDGKGSFRSGSEGNAHAVKMTCQYWIETVKKTITIPVNEPGRTKPQRLRQVSKAGVLGPEYVVPLKATHKKPITRVVRWKQLQYSQNVTLNFNGLSWPHISVATLGDTTTNFEELADLK